MSRHSGRTPPIPGFSRGVPIIGQPKREQPAGSYFYQVPALILRPGQPMDAESFEFAFPVPLEGALFKSLAPSIVEHLQKREPDQPAPKVVMLAPIFLGFIPQEQLDAAKEQAEAEKAVTIQ